MWTMNIWLQKGKRFYWGSREWSAVEIMEAHAVAKGLNLVPPAMEQPQYNLFGRAKMEKDCLPVFSGLGMGTTIWSPLASGLLSGKYNNGIPEDSRLALSNYAWLKERMMQDDKLAKVSKLAEVAKELDTSLATLAIAWCIRNPNVTTAILGATKEQQLTENLQAVEVCAKLTPSVIEQIEGIMQTRPLV